nr:protein FAM161A-like [Onthophagus taurus]
MSDHTSAVFNNSCLKIPRNPVSKQPFPVYDQKFIHHLENQARKLSLESDCLNINNKSKGASEKTLKSFIEFYDKKQRDYYEYLDRNGDWIDEYKNLSNDEYKRKHSNKSILNVHKEDNESISSCEKDIKPPSRRSVRIESPSEKFSPEESPDLPYFRSKSRANVSSSAGSKGHNTTNDSFWDFCSVDECPFDQNLTTRSAPNSPCKSKFGLNWKDDGITIPKPFEMTVRDEENKIVDDIMVKTKKNKREEKHEMFRANPVPIESQIPLFDKIMSDQEKRRQKIKKKSKAALKAQMRPFSFTKRDEEIQAITRRLSKSSPCIFLESTPVKYKPFKAKPIPKHIFSDYIYQKMNEDEFYR